MQIAEPFVFFSRMHYLSIFCFVQTNYNEPSKGKENHFSESNENFTINKEKKLKPFVAFLIVLSLTL